MIAGHQHLSLIQSSLKLHCRIWPRQWWYDRTSITSVSNAYRMGKTYMP